MSLTTFKRLTALAVLLTFLSTEVFALPAIQMPGSVSGVSEISENALASQLEIPEVLGRVTERYEPKGASATILHVQDAHTSLEAQRNIRDLLHHLKKQNALDAVFVEGGVGPLIGDKLRVFKKESWNREWADILMKQGVLSGSEYFLLDEAEQAARQPDFQATRVYGVETAELYRKNLTAYRWVLSHKSQSEKFLDSLKTAILTAASATFGAKLHKFFREWAIFQARSSELLRHLEVLKQYAASELTLDFNQPEAQIEWPQLVRVVKLTELEKTLDLQAAAAEHKSLKGWLRQKKLSGSVIQTVMKFNATRGFVNHPQDGVRSLLENFYQTASTQGFDFRHYPALSKLWGVFILREEIDAIKLFQEATRLTDLILDKLAVAEQEKTLVRAYKDYLLLAQGLKLKLTDRDYDQALERRSFLKPSVLAAALNTFNHYPPTNPITAQAANLDAVYDAALLFYQDAKARDQVFFDNMMKRMRSLKASRAVLITGGFHSEGLRAKLKAENLAYAQIEPRIRDLDNAVDYEKTMLLQGAQPHEVNGISLNAPYIILRPKAEESQRAEILSATESPDGSAAHFDGRSAQDDKQRTLADANKEPLTPEVSTVAFARALAAARNRANFGSDVAAFVSARNREAQVTVTRNHAARTSDIRSRAVAASEVRENTAYVGGFKNIDPLVPKVDKGAYALGKVEKLLQAMGIETKTGDGTKLLYSLLGFRTGPNKLNDVMWVVLPPLGPGAPRSLLIRAFIDELIDRHNEGKEVQVQGVMYGFNTQPPEDAPQFGAMILLEPAPKQRREKRPVIRTATNRPWVREADTGEDSGQLVGAGAGRGRESWRGDEDGEDLRGPGQSADQQLRSEVRTMTQEELYLAAQAAGLSKAEFGSFVVGVIREVAHKGTSLPEQAQAIQKLLTSRGWSSAADPEALAYLEAVGQLIRQIQQSSKTTIAHLRDDYVPPPVVAGQPSNLPTTHATQAVGVVTAAQLTAETILTELQKMDNPSQPHQFYPGYSFDVALYPAGKLVFVDANTGQWFFSKDIESPALVQVLRDRKVSVSLRLQPQYGDRDLAALARGIFEILTGDPATLPERLQQQGLAYLGASPNAQFPDFTDVWVMNAIPLVRSEMRTESGYFKTLIDRGLSWNARWNVVTTLRQARGQTRQALSLLRRNHESLNDRQFGILAAGVQRLYKQLFGFLWDVLLGVIPIFNVDHAVAQDFQAELAVLDAAIRGLALEKNVALEPLREAIFQVRLASKKMQVKVTPTELQTMKQRHTPISMLTAYDEKDQQLLEDGLVDITLVGDSYGMVRLKYPDTTHVTMADMIQAVRAAKKTNTRSLLVGDMPYGSYDNIEVAVANARLLREAGADVVKLEGGVAMAPMVRAIIEQTGIPVMGHIAYTPQTKQDHKIDGRTPERVKELLADARALQAAGVFSIVMELVDQDVAALITRQVSIPVIGIGAGPKTDGQVLVIDDLLGRTDFSDTAKYLKGAPKMIGTWDVAAGEAVVIHDYAKAVSEGAFPNNESSFKVYKGPPLETLIAAPKPIRFAVRRAWAGGEGKTLAQLKQDGDIEKLVKDIIDESQWSREPKAIVHFSLAGERFYTMNYNPGAKPVGLDMIQYELQRKNPEPDDAALQHGALNRTYFVYLAPNTNTIEFELDEGPSAVRQPDRIVQERFGVWEISDGEKTAALTNFGAAPIEVSGVWQDKDGTEVRQESGFAVGGGIPFMSENGRSGLSDAARNFVTGDLRTEDGKTVNVLHSPLTRTTPAPDSKVLHGFTDKVEWHVESVSANSITFVIETDEIRMNVEGAQTLADIKGHLRYRQTYTLENGELISTLETTNLSDKDVKANLIEKAYDVILNGGYHPFFRVANPDTFADEVAKGEWLLQVTGAHEVWSTDATPLPLDASPHGFGEAGYEHYDFSTPKPLSLGLELALGGLKGNVTIRLENTRTGEAREVSFSADDFPYLLLWFSKTPPKAGVFSIEPLFTPPNGRNMALSGNKKIQPPKIAPGQTHIATWRTKLTPPGERRSEMREASAQQLHAAEPVSRFSGLNPSVAAVYQYVAAKTLPLAWRLFQVRRALRMLERVDGEPSAASRASIRRILKRSPGDSGEVESDLAFIKQRLNRESRWNSQRAEAVWRAQVRLLADGFRTMSVQNNLSTAGLLQWMKAAVASAGRHSLAGQPPQALTVAASENHSQAARSEVRHATWVEENTLLLAQHRIYSRQFESGYPMDFLEKLSNGEAARLEEFIRGEPTSDQQSFGAFVGLVAELRKEWIQHSEDEGYLKMLTKNWGNRIADLVSQSTLTGGLGALMPDLFEAWKANGMNVTGIHPLWENIKNTPAKGSLLGQHSRKYMEPTNIQFEVELNVSEKFKESARGVKSRVTQIFYETDQAERKHRRVLVQAYKLQFPRHGAPQFYLDAYYLKDEKAEDTEDNRVHLFEEVYSDDKLWRDFHMALFSQASQILIQKLEGNDNPDNIIIIDNEVFTSLPARRLPKAKLFTINHTVFRPGLYEPSRASFELLDFPEWLWDYIVKDKHISIAEFAAETYHLITGVGLAEHLPALYRNIFPTSRHKLRGWKDELRRSTNGVFFPRWQSPYKRKLIEAYKTKLLNQKAKYRKSLSPSYGLPPETTDKKFYEILKQKSLKRLREEFQIRNDFVFATHVAELLLWMRHRQGKTGKADWLGDVMAKYRAAGGVVQGTVEEFLTAFQREVREAVDADEKRWSGREGIVKKYVTLMEVLNSDPIVTNIRRQVPYKGPDKWIELFVKDAAVEVLRQKGKDYVIHLLQSYGDSSLVGQDKNNEGERDLARSEYWVFFNIVKRSEGDEWIKLMEAGFGFWREGLLQGAAFREVWNLLPQTQAVEKLRHTARAILGGRTFDERRNARDELIAGAVYRFEKIKQIISHLHLEDRFTTIEDYNYNEAQILFQAASGAVMLSDEFLEASATSMEKVDANDGEVDGVFGGADPEIWTFEDRQGKEVPVLDEKGRPIMTHEQAAENIRNGTWKLVNGGLVEYVAVLDEMGRPVTYKTYKAKVAKGEWRVISGHVIQNYGKNLVQEVSDQSGGWRRPSATSLRENLERIKRLRGTTDSRRKRQWKVGESSWKVDMVTGQAQAHANLMEEMLRAEREKERVFSTFTFNLEDAKKLFLSKESPFVWHEGRDRLLDLRTASGLLGFIDSFRRLKTWGSADERGQSAGRSMVYHAMHDKTRGGDWLHYIDAVVSQLSDQSGEFKTQVATWLRAAQSMTDSENPNHVEGKIELNLLVLDWLDQYLQRVIGQVFDSYLLSSGSERAEYEAILSQELFRKNLSRYLESNTHAIRLQTASKGIHAFAYRPATMVDSEPALLVLLNVGQPIAEDGKGRTHVLSNHDFRKHIISSDLTDNTIFFSMHDVMENKDYKDHDREELRSQGLGVGVPQSLGIQILEARKTRKKLVFELKAALGRMSSTKAGEAATALKTQLIDQQLTSQERQALLSDIAKMSVKSARHHFGEDGIPAVMAFVGLLAPELLMDKSVSSMHDWDHHYYRLLRAFVGKNSSLLRDGKVALHTTQTNGSIAFSFVKGKERYLAAVQFSVDTHISPIQNGRINNKITDLGEGQEGLQLARDRKYRLSDGIHDNIFLNARGEELQAGSELLEGLAMEIPFDQQKGGRFQILRIQDETDARPIPEPQSRRVPITPVEGVHPNRIEELAVAVNIMDHGIEVVDEQGNISYFDSLDKFMEMLPFYQEKGVGKIYFYGGLYRMGELSQEVHAVETTQRHFLPEKNPDPKTLISVNGYATKRSANHPYRDNHGNGFSIYSMLEWNAHLTRERAKDQVHDGSPQETKKQMGRVIKEAHRFGIKIRLDFIPWFAPEAIGDPEAGDRIHYKQFFYRELPMEVNRAFNALATPQERKDFLKKLIAPEENQNVPFLKRAFGLDIRPGGYFVRRYGSEGNERLVLIQHMYGQPGVDQAMPNPFHPEIQRYYKEVLRELIEMGVDEVRVDLPHLLRNFRISYAFRDWVGGEGFQVDANAGFSATEEPWIDIFSYGHHYAAELKKTFEFDMEAYEDDNGDGDHAELDRAGADRFYFSKLQKIYAAGGNAQALAQLFQAAFSARFALTSAGPGMRVAPRKYTIFPSNFDERAVREIDRAGRRAFLSVFIAMANAGLPVMIDQREMMDHLGQFAPIPGEHHLFPADDEVERLKTWDGRRNEIESGPGFHLLDLFHHAVKIKGQQELYFVNNSDEGRHISVLWRAAGLKPQDQVWYLQVTDFYPERGTRRVIVNLPEGLSPDQFKVEGSEGREYPITLRGGRPVIENIEFSGEKQQVRYFTIRHVSARSELRQFVRKEIQAPVSRFEMHQAAHRLMMDWATTGELKEASLERFMPVARRMPKLAAAVLVERAPAYVSAYGTYLGSDGASTAGAVEDYLAFEGVFKKFAADSPEAFETAIRHTLDTQDGPLHFNWIMPYQASLRPWLESFLDVIDKLSAPSLYGDRVSASIALVTADEDYQTGSAFFSKFEATGHLQRIDPSELRVASAAMNDFLSAHENALAIGLPQNLEGNVMEKHHVRLVGISGLPLRMALPISSVLLFRTAQAAEITEELLGKLPFLFPQGMLGYDAAAGRLIITTLAERYLQEASISRHLATMA